MQRRETQVTTSLLTVYLLAEVCSCLKSVVVVKRNSKQQCKAVFKMSAVTGNGRGRRTGLRSQGLRPAYTLGVRQYASPSPPKALSPVREKTPSPTHGRRPSVKRSSKDLLGSPHETDSSRAKVQEGPKISKQRQQMQVELTCWRLLA